MQQESLQHIRNRLNASPTSPGVYRWLNAKGDVLYIGKAKNLKNRLKSYVQKEADKSIGPWKLSLRKHIADFDVTVTQTELEALILETNLIKECKPKYNVLMKDDKNYVYVRISDEQYPDVRVVRQMDDDTATYFGPFVSAYNIKRTLDTLHEIFRFRACKKSIEQHNAERAYLPAVPKPCLQYQIGQCNGLCVGDVTQKQYQDAIEEVMRFLKGNHKSAMHALKDLMDTAAAEKKFERAAKLRDTLVYIQSLEEKQVVSDTSRENTDAIGIALQGGKIQAVVLRERNGKMIDERQMTIAGEKDSIPAILCEFIPQYYAQETDIPDLVLIQEDIDDKAILETWLKSIRNKTVKIRAAERGKKSKLLSLATSNAQQKIAQQYAKWEAAAKNIENALQDLTDVLNLPSVPKRIEGYDISHLGGTETVGSMVVMKNGKPANKEYRSFTLRTVMEGEIDDYKAMKEVLRRRLRYLSDAEKKLKEKGITIGKARKAEQKILEEISEKSTGKIGIDDIRYQDYTVARKDNAIIGFARLFKRPGNILQLRSVWVDEDLRGMKLGHAIINKILSGVKKEKVYIIIDPQEHREEYYAEIGFQHVKTPPKVLQEATEAFCKEHPSAQLGNIMVYIALQHKTDSSLTSQPDLLVIDGGKGQLSAVVEVLKDLDIDIPVIGLAKREEEIFTTTSAGIPARSPVDLPKNSQASLLLQRLRDEAHRFSNAHREKRLAKGLVASALDDVPGIGLKTKALLLKKFQTVDNIKKAPDDELLTILNQTQLTSLRSSRI